MLSTSLNCIIEVTRLQVHKPDAWGRALVDYFFSSQNELPTIIEGTFELQLRLQKGTPAFIKGSPGGTDTLSAPLKYS